MNLEGSLDAFSLPDIFQLLSFTKKSGALRLSRTAAGRTQQGVVHVRDGALTGASSDVAREGLVRRLVGAGLVDDDALEAAVARAADDGGVSAVRALREAGALSEQQAREVGTEHVTDAVFDLLRWSEGDFAFAVDDTTADDLGVALTVDEVVTEARRRLEEWATLAQAIPSPDLVLALAPAPQTDLAVARDEWPLLALVDGRRTVRELVSLSGRGEFAVVRALAALVDRGLVVVGAENADGASALLRRQRLLASLEGAEAPAESGTAASAQPAAQTAVQTAEPADDEADDEAAEEPPARTRPSAGAVVPPRPEPFAPRRRPDFPEEPVPVQRTVVTAGLGGSAPVDGTAAVDPARVEGAPSSLIERDPSVNKSLLLRLIAGVRGL